MSISTTNRIPNNITGFATAEQLALIEHWAKEVPRNGKIVEIGSFAGRSAYHWAKSAHPSVTVFAIDTWDDTLYTKYKNRRHVFKGNSISPSEVECCIEHFRFNTKNCPNIVPIQARSPDIPLEYNEILKGVDLVYIDDCHINPEFNRNMYFWYKRLKPRGVFCGDDFQGSDVQRTVVNFATKHKKQLYSRSHFWRLYDYDEFIDLNQLTVIRVRDHQIHDI